MAPSRRTRVPLNHGADWLLSAAMLAALALAAWGLGSILADRQWWVVGVLVASIVFLAAAMVRQFTSRQGWASVGAVVAAVVTLTAGFAPQSALLFVVPTLDTLEAFRLLELEGTQSIATQTVPADAGVGIVFLLCVGMAAIAVVMDAAAHLFKAPAIAGLPLLVLLLVPGSVDPKFADLWIFALVAVAYLSMLLVRSTASGRRVAVGISVTALVGALILPLVLPAVGDRELGGGTGPTLTAGINPIVSLGSDLRRGESVLALTYMTSTPHGQYLRLTSLDDFSGTDWKPSNFQVIPGNNVDAFPPPPGLGEGIGVVEVVTEVEVASILSRWLPVPYAPTSVAGLEGPWSWEPNALAIRTEDSNARGQSYTVVSSEVTPTVEQLRAAPQAFDESFDRYLQLPRDLPESVPATAQAVAGDASSDYDAAIALQNFFRGGEFTYSEETPVVEDFDGSGAAALEPFLEVRAGYCVHFSSAMAAMARSLGIPARIAVGFTPGSETSEPGSEAVTYSVTTYDLHAWPELFFTGIGWVRFEPTPGRGDLPSFAPLAADDPTTPEVDESVPQPVPTSAATSTPPPAPTSTSTAAPGDRNDPDEAGAQGPSRAADNTPLIVVLALVLLLAFAPWAIRVAQRARRMADVRRGSATQAWNELYSTADDLGRALDDALTPRQAAEELRVATDDPAQQAISRLLAAVESESFAERAAQPDTSDVRSVLRSLRRKTGFGRRIRAALIPRSLVRAWMPQPINYELQ